MPFDFAHPALAPVLSRAMSAVMDVLALDERTAPALIRELEYAAAVAMTEAYGPIADAAFRLDRSAEASRTTVAASVRHKAEEAAVLVSETATALQQRHDRSTERAAADATAAARALAASAVPGQKLAAKKQAVEQAYALRDAAATRTDQRAADATLTAAAADQAAVRLAIEAEIAAVLVEGDTVRAAAAAQAAVLDRMYDVAVDAACRHFGRSHM